MSYEIVAYGVDYVRIEASTPETLLALETAFDYLDIRPSWYHGKRFVDLSGKALAMIRMVDDIEEALEWLARDHRITRVDFFIDVKGDVLSDCQMPGTVIMNYGKIETVYSHNLKSRGDYPVFARVYDAMSAGHYPVPVTRFEVEFKKEMVPGIVNHVIGFGKTLPSVTLWHIKSIYGVDISLPSVVPFELNAERQRLSPSRERFYNRFGKGIMLDVAEMGVEQFLMFVYTCSMVKEYANETNKQSV